jgi:GWxTD domain-containing protein
MTKKIKIYLIPLMLLFGASSSHAQHFGHDMRNYFDFGEQFYAACEESADASSLEVRINTANALFSFLKSDKANSSRGAYYAIRDISIELREKPAGQTLKAINFRDTIFTNTFAETTSKESWNSLVRSVPLDGIITPKPVEAHIEIRDGFLARLANRPATLDVALRSFRRERSLTGADSTFIGLSDILILEKPVDPYTYRSKNWGAATEFSRDITGGVTIALQKNIAIDSISIKLTQIGNVMAEKDFQPVVRAHQSIRPEDIISNKIIKASGADSEIFYKITDPEKFDSVYRVYAMLFLIPGKMLEQGKYRLDARVSAGGFTRSFSQPLELVWHYMPLSLENPRDAIPPMQHITTDEEFKDISSGSREEQMKKLYAFWKKQDPTPETAYNERMDEFYRRADYAYFNFARSARMIDGALTDRGKIYILYGPPTNIERTFLLGEQPVEIWTYSNNVKKIVRFTDPGGHGDYKLADVKSM